MASRTRNWDDRWQQYPASKPITVNDGIATSKQRGDMAATWWSRRIVDLLDSYGLGARLQRGRRYARQGQLLSLDVQAGLLVAQVQGSRPVPYVVTVAYTSLPDERWRQVEAAMTARVAFAAQLLAGTVPPELEAVFEAASVDLLPARWADLRNQCSCPDWENPCKHIAAVLYVFGDRLDDDPWLLLAWRGRGRDELLGHLRAPGPALNPVAPWWPLTPGATLPDGPAGPGAAIDIDPDADPSLVLRRCQPLPVAVRDTPVTVLLSAAYDTFAQYR